MQPRELCIGVLALQGAFAEHESHLRRCDEENTNPEFFVRPLLIRRADQLDDSVHALIVPGGESTTIARFLERGGLKEAIQRWRRDRSRPVFGTCAGLILLSNCLTHQKDGGQVTLGGIDITADRNFYGRQKESHERLIRLSSEIADEGEERSTGVFIRAPGITSIDSAEVKPLAWSVESDKVVAVRQGPVMVTEFHPELTPDLRWHHYFIRLVAEVSNIVNK